MPKNQLRGAQRKVTIAATRGEEGGDGDFKRLVLRGVKATLDDGDGELSWFPPGLQEWERDVKEGSRKTKESGRGYRDASFTPERWAAHRSVGRYWRHIIGIPSSRVVQGLLAPCSFTAGVALVACASRQYYSDFLGVSSPIPFELTAASLGLMLVFRTNESYARVVRAHDAWNLVMSRAVEARYITLGCCKDPELRGLLGRYLLAYPIALKNKYHPLPAFEDSSGDAGESAGDAGDGNGDGDGDDVAFVRTSAGGVLSSSDGFAYVDGGGGGSGGGGGAGVAKAGSGMATDGSSAATGLQIEPGTAAGAESRAGTGARARARAQAGMRRSGVSPDLERVLRPAEALDMSRRVDMPGHALQVLYRAAGYLGDQEGVRMPTLGRFMECLAAFSGAARQCDMLTTTPIPLSYTRHTSRFLMIWLSLLAFPLADELSGFAAVPALFFISMLYLGVEEIGVQIEEPLSIMDLEGMVAALEVRFEEAEGAAQDVDALLFGMGIGISGGGGGGGYAEEEAEGQPPAPTADPEPEPEEEIVWWKKTRFYE